MVYCKHCQKDVESFRSWCSECGHNLADLDRLFLKNKSDEATTSRDNIVTSKKKEARIFDFLSIAGNQFLS